MFIFNIEKTVLRDVFTMHPSKFYDEPEKIAEIVDEICEYNIPNTPTMKRICSILEENYNIWEREELAVWLIEDARYDFRKYNINIYIMTINDGDASDEDMELEKYFDREVETLKRRGFEVFVLNSDFNYYELYYFSKDMEKEAIAMLELIEIMASTYRPFNLQKL